MNQGKTFFFLMVLIIRWMRVGLSSSNIHVFDQETCYQRKKSGAATEATDLRLSGESEGMMSAGRHPHHLLIVQTLDAQRL